MKYIENKKLTELTAELTDAIVGQSHRVINGRIEAYIMKRAGSDKKFAHALGQKYVAEIEEMHKELAESAQRMQRKRSLSVDDNTKQPRSKKGKSNLLVNTSTTTTSTTTSSRSRSYSFDTSLDITDPKTTLGDFSELATRRLMTDLILTLNASFPDYDFSNVKLKQFEKLDIVTVRERISECLTELATSKPNDWLMELWTAVNDVIDLKECDLYSFEEDYLGDESSSLWSFHYFFVNKSLRRVVFFTCCEKIPEDQEEAPVEQEEYYAPDVQVVDDFEWDPSADVAGGIPISIM